MKLSKLGKALPYLIMVMFALWCAMRLRADLAQVSFSQLLSSWDLIALATTLSILNYVLRIIRWRSYLKHLGYALPRRFTALTFLAGFAYTVSPGKVGELVRARYYMPLGIPLTEVAGAFFTERFLDLVVMIFLAALLFVGGSGYQGVILGSGIAAIVILVTLALLPWQQILQWLETARLPTALRHVAVKIARMLISSRVLLSPPMLAMGLLVGLAAWTLEGVGFYVLTNIFPGTGPNVLSSAGIYGSAVLIGGISMLPGGLGSTEAVMAALLASYGYPMGQAVLITLTCRLVTLWLGVACGWCAILLLRSSAVAEPAPASWR